MKAKRPKKRYPRLHFRWSREELRYLKFEYFDNTMDTLSSHLGRSPFAIRAKACELGLSEKDGHRRGTVSIQEAAVRSGYSQQKTRRLIFELGVPRTRTPHVPRGRPRTLFRVLWEDFKAALERYHASLSRLETAAEAAERLSVTKRWLSGQARRAGHATVTKRYALDPAHWDAIVQARLGRQRLLSARKAARRLQLRQEVLLECARLAGLRSPLSALDWQQCADLHWPAALANVRVKRLADEHKRRAAQRAWKTTSLKFRRVA